MFDLHLACQHDQWPLHYRSIAAPLLRNVILTDEDANLILEKGTCIPVLQHLQTLHLGVDGVFLKLAGFSFRGHPAFDLLNGQVQTHDDLALLCSSVPGRIRWAIHNCLKVGEVVQLDVFRWRAIPPESELRLKVKGRQLISVQRYHNMHMPPDPAQIGMARDVFSWMLPDLPLDDCLIDLTTHYSAAPLIEINPLPSSSG